MGRPRGSKNRVEPDLKTPEQIREEADLRAKDAELEAANLRATAAQLGAEGSSGASGRLVDPEDELAAQNDPLLSLRGEGRVYPFMKIGGREVVLPAYDRSIIDEDGQTIFREHGDGEYKLKVFNRMGYDYSVPWRVIVGFGKGSIADGNRDNMQSHQPGVDPTIISMIEGIQAQLNASIEANSRLQEELRTANKEHSSETMRMFEKMLDNKVNAPVTPVVDPLETLARTVEQLKALGVIPQPGENRGNTDKPDIISLIAEVKQAAQTLGMTEADKDWKKEAVGLLKDALVTLGPGVAAQLKAGAAVRAAAAAAKPLPPKTVQATARPTTQPGTAHAPEQAPAPEAPSQSVAVDPVPEGGTVANLLDMSVWQFMMAKAMRSYPDKFKEYTDKIMVLAREKRDVKLSAQEIIEQIKGMAVDDAGNIDQDKADGYVDQLFEFANLSDAALHLAWAQQEMGVAADEIAANAPWFADLIVTLKGMEEAMLKSLEEDEDDDDDDGDDE